MHKTAPGVARDPWFDNARWLAGSLVVMVHINGGVTYSGSLAQWLHGALNPARIPLFALLVGYFTPALPTPRNLASLVRMLVVPLASISALHIVLNYFWGVRPLFDPLTAQYTLWFVYAVIAWRLICPLIAQLRHPLLIAVVLSLLAGTLQNFDALYLRRIFALLPFVVIGMSLRRNDSWLRVRTPRSTVAAVGVVVAWVAGVTVAERFGIYDRNFVGMIREYSGVGIGGNLLDMAIRAGLLSALALTAMAVLHLTPRVRIPWITYIGAGGFTIYLLHGLVVRLMRNWDLLPRVATAQWWTTPAFVAFAFLLAALLGSRPVRWLARPLVRPRLHWLLKPSPPRRADDVGK